MQCEFYCSEIDALGLESEIFDKQQERIICKADAIHVLRLVTIPQSQVQAHLLYKRLCVCQKHGEYLCNDAPFKWENLPNLTVEEQKNLKIFT